jgi:organic hydroperoxide reductase OsmC/OhrA
VFVDDFRSARAARAIERSCWSGTGEAVLERGPRVPVFSSITLAVTITVDAGDEERARRVLTKAEQSCIISNALAVAVRVEASIKTAPLRSVVA